MTPAATPPTAPELRPRVGLDKESIKKEFQNHLHYDLAVDEHTATAHDRYLALAWAVRDRIIDRWMKTQSTHYEKRAKRVYYLSLEFLIGRSLGNNVINLGIEQSVDAAMDDLGIDWESLRDEEVDAGLGNGGLGRLAACFLESLSTLSIPAYGYSLRYEHGIFEQSFRNGYQIEKPDSWLRGGNPWEIKRVDMRVPVHFGGHVDMHERDGQLVVNWVPGETILGVPHDIPTVGYGGKAVNTLRLWQASSPDEFDFHEFSRGDYWGAVDQKVLAENLTKVLYPSDEAPSGKELRFRQQYFFVACSIHDIMRRFRKMEQDLTKLPELVAIQLNDTHPTLAVPELLRVLVDIDHVPYEKAWEIVKQTVAYTNHTLLSEALETWPADMIQRLLPRHYQLICEINHRFLKRVAARFPGDNERRERMSIIREAPSRVVRMAHLAIVGSHSVNGVAEIHSRLVRERLVPDFAEMYPEKFNNRTNGVTVRRFLLKANPPLASLITEAIGDGWITDFSQIAKLKPFADDADFRQRFRQAKQRAKQKLVGDALEMHGIQIDGDRLFDVQCKRIHTYKRQLLNALHIAMLFNRMHRGELKDFAPTAFIFAGKAAPSFHLAKLIIKLINNMSEIVNNDPLVNDRLAVHFLPNYRVSLAERLIPAADVSEQTSVAGTEASGTGNMKFMMNGAITLGTLDGANIEIVEEVGADNAFIFGLSTEQVEGSKGFYNPWWHYENDGEIRAAIHAIFHRNVFSADEPGIFQPIHDYLFAQRDPYMHLADLRSYAQAHEQAQALWKDGDEWDRRAILNVASSGKFSSDRTIQEYADRIWGVKAIEVQGNHH